MIFEFEQVKEFTEASAYSYFGDPDKVDLLFKGMITDYDLIKLDLEKKYPEKQGYLVIIDYKEEFHIRVYRAKISPETEAELTYL